MGDSGQLASRRGPYAKTIAQRERILSAATVAFGRYGFWGTSMRDIARQVGLSQAGLLHHFPGKAELLTQLLEDCDRASFEAADRAAADGVPVQDQLVGVMSERIATPGLARLLTTMSAEAASAEHPLHSYMQERYERNGAFIAGRVATGQAAGDVRSGLDPVQCSRIMMASFVGLQTVWLLNPSVDVVALMRITVDAVLSADPAPLPAPLPAPSPAPRPAAPGRFAASGSTGPQRAASVARSDPSATSAPSLASPQPAPPNGAPRRRLR